MDIFTPIRIGNTEIRNRIVFPPFVNFGWSDTDGKAGKKHIEHYRLLARGGTGLIIVEATCVAPHGRIFSYQLGLWDDKQIAGQRNIASACKAEGATVLVQLHHAGLLTRKAVSDKAYGPSTDPDNERSVALSAEEIVAIREAFVAAAIRARNAGFHGIELHGAHGYLLNQFTNSAINRRNDEYGGSLANRLKLSREIITDIRSAVGTDFIIGYRLAGCSPTLNDGIAIAKELEQLGVDLIHVSHGGTKGVLPEIPDGFEFNPVVYMGTEIKKQLGIPVITVNQIQTPQRANKLIQSGMADMVAIGRDMAIDPEWVNKAKRGESIHYCIDCKPKCKRYVKAESCPLYGIGTSYPEAP